MLKVFGIITAHTHIAVAKKPGGQPAEVPFGAYIRAGSDYCIEPNLLSSLQKTPYIKPPCKIELSLLRLVQIPAHIGFNRVEACRLEFFQSVFPVFGQNAEIVYSAGIDVKLFTVHFKTVAVYF